MGALRVLTFTTLYPNAEMPNLGVFVENRLRQTLKYHPDIQPTVIAPVRYFPSTSPVFGSYARYAKAPLQEVRHGITVHHPRFFLIPKVGMHMAAWLLYRGSRAAFRRLGISKDTVDVIDAHYYYPDCVVAAMLARDLDIPFVATARGTDLNVLTEYPVLAKQIAWAAQQSAAAIAVSSALRAKLLELGVEREKAVVVRNGVDLDLFKPLDRDAARRRLGLNGYTLLSVGNLIPLKGHDLAIEAMVTLSDCTLLIAGGGAMKDELQARIVALGVGERVRLLGEVPHAELPALYGAADALVLMSEREGWANVLLEAMACGTPVLATNVGGNGEMVTGPHAGALLRERSTAALADAVGALRARNPDRAFVRRHAEGFGWKAVAAANYALLSAAAQSRGQAMPAASIVARAMAGT